MFTRVASLNEGSVQADRIVNLFDNAMLRNSPLRTDTEEALMLMKKAVNISQNACKDQLLTAADEYAEIMDQLEVIVGTEAVVETGSGDFNSSELEWD